MKIDRFKQVFALVFGLGIFSTDANAQKTPELTDDRVVLKSEIVEYLKANGAISDSVTSVAWVSTEQALADLKNIDQQILNQMILEIKPDGFFESESHDEAFESMSFDR